MQRLTYIIIVLLLAMTLPAFAEESPFNVDVFFGWDGYYRPTEWTPVEIGISSDLEEFFSGSIKLSAKQDGLNTMNIRHDFVLTPNIPQHIPLVSKFSFNAEKCNASLIDTKKRRVVWNQSYSLWDFSNQKKLKAVKENDLLIGLVGNRGFGLIKLPDTTQCSFTGENSRTKGKICIGDKLPRMTPWDWTGYSSLDLLILYAPDWSRFKPQQLTAISQWVSKGGKLLLIPGASPIGDENPINAILPYRVSDARQTTLAADDLKSLRLNPSESETVVARPIFTDGRLPLYKLASSQSGQCLFVSANAGFGTVGILALDPDDLSDKQKNNTSHFWVNCITMMLESKDSKYQSDFKPVVIKSKSNRNGGYNQDINKLSMSATRTIEMRSKTVDESSNNFFQTGLSQAGSNAVLEYLYNISEMRPLGILPVIFLLLLLAVLVGPVDYIFLKRKDILPMTWVTSTFWIVLFSFGAYHGVQALRGGSLQMRHVSVVDAISNPNAIGGVSDAWTTNYSAIFAPGSDDYELVDERDNQWFSAISPAEQQIYSYNRQGGSKQIHCVQHDGSNKPYSLPINIWTMQCLINESPADQLPIRATCTQSDKDVTVRIDNLSSTELKGGYILFDGNRYLEFSAVPAKDKKEFTGRLKGGKKWDFTVQQISSGHYSGSRHFTEKPLEAEKTFSAQGCLRRSRSIQDYLAGGAAVVCATFEDAPVPYRLQKKKCEYKHIQLVRLVVFPEQKSKDIAYDQN
ncbi:MAG: hypothetical protein K9M75_04475 [Phycisphaerae bacterium]|nr:hypothetical protein [Phycisphaerae bacterium]